MAADRFATDYSFYRVFSSGMVLQRNQPVKFAGLATPNHSVQIEFGGETQLALADGNGEWQVEFPARPATLQAQTVVLSGAENCPPVILEDVLIGEVWFCGGQSNMEMPMQSDRPFWSVKNAAAELACSENPYIRLFNSTAAQKLSPFAPCKDDPNRLGWQKCTPENLRSFSGCAYFFARQLQKNLQIPIGVIGAGWGGTKIQAWISQKKFEAENYQPAGAGGKRAEEFWTRLNCTTAFKKFVQWVEKYNTIGGADPQKLLPDWDDSTWQTATMQQLDSFPIARRGRYLIRINLQISPELAGQDMIFRGMTMKDADFAFFNGDFIGKTGIETHNYQYAVRHYPIPGKLVKAGRNTVAFYGDVYKDGGLLCVPLKPFLQKDHTPLELELDFRIEPVVILSDDYPTCPETLLMMPPGPDFKDYPSGIFNGVVFPHLQYNIGGVIWYQGCSDSNLHNYYVEHKMLIEDWREHWQNPLLPFILVQLAGFDHYAPGNRISDEEIEKQPVKEVEGFALTREIQAAVCSVAPQIGMVTAIDCGDSCDIHPADKQTVGFRLAQKAMTMLFDQSVISDGPEFDGMRIEDNRIRIFFKNTFAGLHTTDGDAPRGFFVCGREGVWYAADAIIEGNTVVISSNEELYPQRARYAFCGFRRVNLVNSAGWPALPFRSDAPDYRKMFR